MIATYAAALAVCGVSLALGQAAILLSGARRWSWLSAPVGLALLCAICWATVRLPGGGLLAAILVLGLVAAALALLRGRTKGGGEALRAGAPVALLALLAASLPFAGEGHFGILGTGFNPDMSQHLLATDRLGEGVAGDLWRQGYPLGPHAVVVALQSGLGIGLVQGFSGLTIAIAVLAALTALTAFADRPPIQRIPLALVVGLPYLVASYFAQGAVKETAQALLVLAFLLALRESDRNWHHLTLRYTPAALIAIGVIYIYSFPGLIWLTGIAVIWTLLRWPSATSQSPAGGVDIGVPSRVSEGAPMAATGPAGQRSSDLRAAALALVVFAVGALPELGRMIEFQRFETFDPAGPGLGNLFGQVSPFTALGIWPTGDFRVAAGDGAMPALAFQLGAAFALAVLVAGLHRAWLGREHTILAGVVTVAGVYLAARLGGTPYTAAKALAIAAPVLTLAILAPPARPGGGWRLSRNMSDQGASGSGRGAWPYLLAAGACSLLGFANAPVGPTSYSPALTALRPLLGSEPTLVLAPARLLEERHGRSYLAWELRGGRVCIEPERAATDDLPPGIRFVVTARAVGDPPFERLSLRRRAGPYAVWERRGVAGGPSPCPLITVRQARRGP